MPTNQPDEQINIEIFEGKSKKDDKPYTAIRVVIGTWSQLIFAKTKFELDYIKHVLEQNKD